MYYKNVWELVPPTTTPKFYQIKVTPHVIVARDDFDFKGLIPNNIMKHEELVGASFHIQKQMQDSFNNESFVINDIIIGNKNYSLITSNIPTVCEDGSYGVVFILCEELTKTPEDSEAVFKIFNRLLCNWMSRYNECIEKRRTHLNENIT